MPGKHHLRGFKIAKKNRLAATRLVDDAPHRRWVKPPPPLEKKARSAPVIPTAIRYEICIKMCLHKKLNTGVYWKRVIYYSEQYQREDQNKSGSIRFPDIQCHVGQQRWADCTIQKSYRRIWEVLYFGRSIFLDIQTNKVLQYLKYARGYCWSTFQII